MELIETYQNALYELNKSHYLVKNLDEQLCIILKNCVEKRYLGKQCQFKENWYECRGVKITLDGALYTHTDISSVLDPPAHIVLAFFLTTPTNKIHKEKIEQALIKFQDKGFLPYHNTKTELWLDMSYTVKVKKLLTDSYSLSLDIT